MPSLGAGLGDAGASVTGDALIAEEPAQARYDTPPEAPKPTNKSANTLSNKPTVQSADAEAATETDNASSGDEPGSVIALAGRTIEPEAAKTTAVTRAGGGLVTVRPKPEKRKNAKEKAKEKYTKDGTTPDTTAKAKSKVDKAEMKAKKADTKARKISAIKAAKAAKAA